MALEDTAVRRKKRGDERHASAELLESNMVKEYCLEKLTDPRQNRPTRISTLQVAAPRQACLTHPSFDCIRIQCVCAHASLW
jgi:hypothetical protein